MLFFWNLSLQFYKNYQNFHIFFTFPSTIMGLYLKKWEHGPSMGCGFRNYTPWLFIKTQCYMVHIPTFWVIWYVKKNYISENCLSNGKLVFGQYFEIHVISKPYLFFQSFKRLFTLIRCWAIRINRFYWSCMVTNAIF